MGIARNSIYNLAGQAAPIVVSLLTVPLYLKIVGVERYGVLSICWLILGYFGFFDLGIGRAVSQRIAKLGSGAGQEQSDTFWSGLAMSAALSGLAVLVFLPASQIALGMMHISDPMLQAEAM